MNILIVNHNGGSIYHGPNLRTYFAAKELVKLGHKVTIASSSFSHKYSVLPVVKGVVTEENIDGVEYRWIRCTKYSNLAQRIFSHFEFGSKIIRHKRKICTEADVVIFSGPPPEIFLFSWLLAKLLGAPIISDIRDFWPRTQLEMSRWQWLNPFTYFLFCCQFLLVRYSNRLVSPLPGAESYLSRVGAKTKVRVIENGYDLNHGPVLEPTMLQIAGCGKNIGYETGSHVALSEIKDLGKFIVGYAGAFDRDNDIDSLLLAAKELKGREDIIFFMIGAGIKKEEVVEATRTLPNLLVCERVPSNSVLDVLSIMDVCFCGLKPKEIYKYGVSLAKSFEYMAASKPILWMIDAFNNPVRESGGGVVIEPGNIGGLVAAIETCAAKGATELSMQGRLGFVYLNEKHSYEVLGHKWDKLVSEFDCSHE
ncbi:MAG: glycosyltransferase family 4 protein [Colwellia sp.]|nr:glycosyltransferase family 4 protein [Colwellia sp.]